MIIRIMRHGDAPFIQGQRQLSEHGEQEVQAMGAWLEQQAQPDLVLVSPILRAQQTWQQLKPFVKDSLPVTNENLLKPEANASLAIEYFATLEQSSLLLISHMPLVTNLMEACLPGQGRFFPTAAVAQISLKNGIVKLEAFVSPSDL